jgi:hypothetical protein
MRKLKAIWRLIFASEFLVYTTKTFGIYKIEERTDEYDLRILNQHLNNLIEAEESLQYTKSILTEI